MARKTTAHHMVNYFFWNLIFQGVSAIVLGILILVYPPVLFAIVAFTFFWFGITTIMLAWKVRAFRKELLAEAGS